MIEDTDPRIDRRIRGRVPVTRLLSIVNRFLDDGKNREKLRKLGWHPGDGRNPAKLLCDSGEASAFSLFGIRGGNLSSANAAFWLLHYASTDPISPEEREIASRLEELDSGEGVSPASEIPD